MRIKSSLSQKRLQMKALRERRKREQKCVDCGAPASSYRCPACKALANDQQRERRQARMENDQCTVCGAPLPPPEEWTRTKCPTCWVPTTKKPKITSQCEQCGKEVVGFKPKRFCSARCQDRFEVPTVECGTCGRPHSRRNTNTDRFLLHCSEECKRIWDRSAGYDITPAGLKAMLDAQEGKCAICGEEGSLDTLAVDHCHTKGHVRGLLCRGCNIGLGAFRDSPGALTNALRYLGVGETTTVHP